MALGSKRIVSTESEEQKQEFRRSIVINKALGEGHILQEDDLDFKRPGGGYAPEYKDYLVGRKICRDLEYDHILTKDDLY